MDKIDVKILRVLQNNARITVSEMSSIVNLSISAVSERLKKLEVSGIIEQYTTIINPSFLNKKLTAIMFIALEKPKYTDNFTSLVLEEEEILDCFYLAGDFDYMLKIITEDTYTLEQLLNRIKGIHGISKTKTIVALSTVKNKHSIIPNYKIKEGE